MAPIQDTPWKHSPNGTKENLFGEENTDYFGSRKFSFAFTCLDFFFFNVNIQPQGFIYAKQAPNTLFFYTRDLTQDLFLTKLHLQFLFKKKIVFWDSLRCQELTILQHQVSQNAEITDVCHSAQLLELSQSNLCAVPCSVSNPTAFGVKEI